MSKSILLLSVALTLLLAACSVSLAADVTPPANYRSPTAPIPTQPAVLPAGAASPSQGAAIYTEKCAPCHGPSGRGDGAQASALGLPVPAIGTADVARKARPADWYALVTNGRMDRGMPPFRSLNDQQRWDVVAYTLTLSDPPALVQQGRALYDQKCASCHGTGGRGDGPEAARSAAKLPNWSESTRLAQRSASELEKIVASGAAPAMPAFAGQLSQEERWALVAYVRTLAYASAAPGQVAAATPVATSAATSAAQPTPALTGTPAPFKVAVTGKVSRSNGAALPAGLKVTLQGYDSMVPTWSASVDLQPDGTYRFNDVEVVSGRTFLATVEYLKVPFDSEPLHASSLTAGKEASLPITLSEVISDPAALVAQRMHIFLDFSVAGRIQVAELFIIENPGDKTVAPAAADQPALRFELPQGAENLSFEDGALGNGRYAQTANGFGDLTAVRPGDQLQVLFGYDVAYTGKQVLSIPIDLPVTAAVIMIPSGGVTLESSQLRLAGEQSIEGATIKMFSSNNLAAGSKLALNLAGQPGAAGTAVGAIQPTELVVGVGVFGVALIAAGVLLYRRRRSDTEKEVGADEEVGEDDEGAEDFDDEIEDTPDALLDAIVALDDLYQAGELPEAAYQQRRAELKARLKAIQNG